MAGRPAEPGGGGGVAAAAAADGRQIEAFTVHDVVTDKRLLCLEAWSSSVLLGLSDGTLLLASQQPRGPSSTGASRQASGTPAGGSTPAGGTPQAGTPQGGSEAGGSDTEAEGVPREQPWRVVRSIREFGMGRVKQLVVARERSMLLCLADDGVNAFDLPAMRLKGQAGRTRGAALFAWHGPTDTLAVAAKRRLLLFKYDGLEFVEQREVSLPDAAACMQLAGGTLYVGLAKRDYVAVDVATGGVTQLFTTKGPAAAMVTISPSEVLLARDASCVRYGPDGRPAKRAKPKRGSGGAGVKAGAVALAWSAPPAALGSSGPYVLGLTEQGAEARLLEPLTVTELWQQLPLGLPGGGSGGGSGSGSAAACLVASSTAEDGSLFVAGREGGAVKQLRPVPFAQQAQQALEVGEHEEALALAALMPSEKAQERKQLEDRIHLSFGQRLFREEKFEEALLHFGMSSLAGPLELLRLFPSLAPPQLLAAAAAEQAEGEEGEEGEARQQGSGEAAAGAAGAAAGAAAAAAGGQQEAAGQEAAEPSGDAYVAAVQVLTPYLLSHRSRLAAAAASPPPKPLRGAPVAAAQQQQQQGVLAPVPSAAASDVMSPSPSTRAALVQQRLEGSAMAALLDTALLLALLASPDTGALLRFVQRPNWVDLEAGEAALRSAGRYSELVALYQSKGRHSAALDLLHALSQQPDQLPAPAQGASAELRGLPGVWAAVKYVCHMPEEQRDLALISTHAKWMLAADPDAGLEMFSNMQPPLPPSAVLPILTTYAPKLAGTYLETALASGAADPAVYEQELAKIYLERVVGSAAPLAAPPLAAPPLGTAAGSAAAGSAAASGSPAAAAAVGRPPAQALPEEYGKLKKLILASRHLDYEALLRVVPQQGLLELRAALLERLGRHTEALRIYVHRLRQLPLAEAYCDRVYARRQQQLKEVRHAELAAALRRQRSQRDTAAAGMAGGNGYTLARPMMAATGGMAGGSGSGSGGTARSLPFGSTAGGAGVPATKLQPAPGSSSAEDGADIYLLLVQVLLEEEHGRGGYRPVQHAPDHQVWGDVARLLSRKRDTIQPLKALGLLPGEVPLSSALPFLEGALWGASERRRTAALARNLRRSEHIALLGQLADERQRSVLLTPERNCSICYKRVGTAALVAFPTGLLAHYSCYRRAAGSGTAAAGRSGATAVGGAVPMAAAVGSSFQSWA